MKTKPAEVRAKKNPLLGKERLFNASICFFRLFVREAVAVRNLIIGIGNRGRGNRNDVSGRVIGIMVCRQISSEYPAFACVPVLLLTDAGFVVEHSDAVRYPPVSLGDQCVVFCRTFRNVTEQASNSRGFVIETFCAPFRFPSIGVAPPAGTL